MNLPPSIAALLPSAAAAPSAEGGAPAGSYTADLFAGVFQDALFSQLSAPGMLGDAALAQVFPPMAILPESMAVQIGQTDAQLAGLTDGENADVLMNGFEFDHSFELEEGLDVETLPPTTPNLTEVPVAEIEPQAPAAKPVEVPKVNSDELAAKLAKELSKSVPDAETLRQIAPEEFVNQILGNARGDNKSAAQRLAALRANVAEETQEIAPELLHRMLSSGAAPALFAPENKPQTPEVEATSTTPETLADATALSIESTTSIPIYLENVQVAAKVLDQASATKGDAEVLAGSESFASTLGSQAGQTGQLGLGQANLADLGEFRNPIPADMVPKSGRVLPPEALTPELRALLGMDENPNAAASSTLPDQNAIEIDNPTAGDRSAAALAQVDRVEFVERMTQALEKARAISPKHLELELNPPSLGKLRIQVTSEQGQLTARIEVASQSARSLLMEQMSTLDRHMSEHGMQLQRIQIEAPTSSYTGDGNSGTQDQSADAQNGSMSGNSQRQQQGTGEQPGQQPGRDGTTPEVNMAADNAEDRSLRINMDELLQLAPGINRTV